MTAPVYTLEKTNHEEDAKPSVVQKIYTARDIKKSCRDISYDIHIRFLTDALLQASRAIYVAIYSFSFLLDGTCKNIDTGTRVNPALQASSPSPNDELA